MTKHGLSLLDLMSLPPLWRQIIRLILRNHELTADEIARILQTQPHADDQALNSALQTLMERHWLIYTDTPPRYRIQFIHQDGALQNSELWGRVRLDDFQDQQYLPALDPALPAENAPSESCAASTPSSNEDVASNEGLLMRRGGKRILSQNIWDKLDAPAPDSSVDNGTSVTSETPPSEPSNRARGKNLLDLF